MFSNFSFLTILFLLAISACADTVSPPDISEEMEIELEQIDTSTQDTTPALTQPMETLTMDSLTTDTMEKILAQITEVAVSGSPNNYTFNVTIASPDTGCDQYADWWEVISPEGTLHYRRVLLHSHVNEQPFARTGGPVAIEADTEVYIRAHMNNLGYGVQIFKGSVSGGFIQDSLAADFAIELATTEPLPDGCAF